MSDSVKDEIARMAMQDMFGTSDEGQKMKETFERTGRLVSEQQEQVMRKPVQRDDSPGVTVVAPIDYKKVAQAVSEHTIVEAIISNPDYSKEKDKAITDVANEARVEAASQLSKILRGLR